MKDLKRAKTQEVHEKTGQITFYSKETIKCPVCETKFNREELHSGGGRLIAGDLTDELRRLYQPSAKYGEIFPCIYHLTVCPKCLFTTFPQDFLTIDKDFAHLLFKDVEKRYTLAKQLFRNFDFTKCRTLSEGALSYYLALNCYEAFDTRFSPRIKQAICAVRAAWLFSELDKKNKAENYGYVSSMLYKKATFLYRYAIDLESTGKEMIAGLKSFGPDIDKNYGYDGVIYMGALLEYKYGPREDVEARRKRMEYQKFALAKMFGLGKSTKEKPGPLLEASRTLYDNLKLELKEDD
ncbi:MAG: DUF2225 domain-containing protein [Treponema sp.]